MWWQRARGVEGAALTFSLARAMRARACLALGVSPGMPGTARIALVGALQRPYLKRGERCSDRLDFCGGAEAAAGLSGGDVESPEGDGEEKNLKVDVGVRAPLILRAENIFLPVAPGACRAVEIAGCASIGPGEREGGV